MKRLILVLVFALASVDAHADGTVAVAPAADPPATWRFTGLCFNTNGPGEATITLMWVTQSGREASLDTDLYPRTIILTGAEMVQFVAAVSPTGSDTFSSTNGAAKRFRQRASKWLIDNGKIARGANE